MNEKEECEVLMNDLLPTVQHLLEKHHEFYPIGAVMNEDDSIVQTATFDGCDFPDSQNVINSLIEAHRKLAEQKRLKVSGIAYNASVMISGKKTDSIMICLEHQNGYSVTVGIPYVITLFKRIKYGNLFAQQGSHDIFADKF